MVVFAIPTATAVKEATSAIATAGVICMKESTAVTTITTASVIAVKEVTTAA